MQRLAAGLRHQPSSSVVGVSSSSALIRRRRVVAAIATSPSRHHRHHVAAAAAAAASAFPHHQQGAALTSSCFCRCYRTTTSVSGDAASFKKNPKIEDNDEEKASSSAAAGAWIPPDRPLVGDKGMQTKGAASIIVNEETELISVSDGVNEKSQSAAENVGDWLQTRRSVMSKTAAKLSVDGSTNTKNGMMPILAIKEHTLLSQHEIMSFLQAMGGSNVQCFLDDPTYRRMGGADGIIIATAQQNSHLHVLANAVIQQLRLRKLQDVGVVAAQLGAEGGAIDNGDDEGWLVVDCENFIVHLLEEHMRKALNLEKLWSGNDDLHKLNFYLDDAVDDYVAANPVPDDYGRRQQRSTTSFSGGGTKGNISSSLDWDAKVKKLQKSQWPTAAAPTNHRRDSRRSKKSASRKKKSS